LSGADGPVQVLVLTNDISDVTREGRKPLTEIHWLLRCLEASSSWVSFVTELVESWAAPSSPGQLFTQYLVDG